MLEILKAFLKVTSGTVLNIVLGSISIKILASVLGPEGFGLFSFLRQIQLTALLTAAGSQNALVQGGASQEGQARQTYLQTVLLFTLLASGMIAIGLFLAAPWLASKVIGQSDNATVWAVRLLALPVFLCALAAYANGVQNVYRQLGQMAVAQIAGAVASVLVAYPAAKLVRQGQISFLPLWMLVLQLGSLTTSLLFLWKKGHLAQLLTNVFAGYQREAIRYFLRFAGVTIFTTFFANIVVLVLRTLIEKKQGLASVGMFEAAWTLSMTNVSLVTVAFGAYYLPTLSALQSPPERVALIQRMFRFATLLALPLIIGVVLLKWLAIQLFFSSEFVPSLTLLRWMLIGDYFKITSWVFAYTMIASADIRMMLWSELIWNSCLLLGGVYSLVSWSSIEGLGVSFSLLYLLYFLFTFSYAKIKHQVTLSRNIVLVWCGGLLLIVLASWQQWNVKDYINWEVLLGWGVVIATYIIVALGRDGRRQVHSYLVKV